MIVFKEETRSRKLFKYPIVKLCCEHDMSRNLLKDYHEKT